MGQSARGVKRVSTRGTWRVASTGEEAMPATIAPRRRAMESTALLLRGRQVKRYRPQPALPSCREPVVARAPEVDAREDAEVGALPRRCVKLVNDCVMPSKGLLLTVVNVT